MYPPTLIFYREVVGLKHIPQHAGERPHLTWEVVISRSCAAALHSFTRRYQALAYDLLNQASAVATQKLLIR
jgi:hypothetical protein